MKRFLFLAALLASSAAFAQSQAPANNGQPIEITADKSVEWLRNQQQYVARENVIVTQGNMKIFADLLTADYRDGAQSSMEIWQLTAEGNVRIADETNTAYGDKGVYDVTQGIATLTGKDLKLVSPDQTVTATDRMEYHANTREAKAIGNAKVVRPKDTLSANIITAFFKADTTTPEHDAAKTPASPLGGGSNLDRLEADGNVVIKTPSETLHGQRAIYRADTNTAELTGNVKIERGPNILEGNRAEVDLDTNISKLFGSEKEGGRVRGVFFPGSEKKPEQESKPAPSPVPAPQPTPETPAPQSSISPVPATPEPANVSRRIEY